MSNILIAYFSASGVTAKKAKDIAAAVNGELFEIAPKKKYSSDDLNWMNKKSRSTIEMQDPASRPELLQGAPDLSSYDKVIIGFPVWWYTAPHIINSFLESVDFSGKEIYLYATSGGSGCDKCLRDLQNTYPELNFVSGKLLNGRINAEEMQDWVK